MGENYDVLMRSDQWTGDATALRNLVDAPSGSLLVYKCTLCAKTFKSHQQCTAHLKTKKHRRAFYDFQQKQSEVSAASTSGNSEQSEAALTETIATQDLKVDFSLQGNPFVEIKPFVPKIPKHLRYAPVDSDVEEWSDV